MKGIEMMTRRSFMTAAGSFCALRAIGTGTDGAASPLVRFGLVTDLHYAAKGNLQDGATTRYYTQSANKLRTAVAVMNARKADFMVELGDFKDLSGDRTGSLAKLDEIEAVFATFEGPRYHVLGNHDMDCLTKEMFFEHVLDGGVRPTCGYYSFVRGGVTFVVLDGCYTNDGQDYAGEADGTTNYLWYQSNLPEAEMTWLRDTLASVKNGPVVVFCHQRIDPDAPGQNTNNANTALRNAAAVRAVLEKSRKVRAVFSGHDHTGGICNHNGIYYYTLEAMVTAPTNSFAEVSVYPSGSVSVSHFRRTDA